MTTAQHLPLAQSPVANENPRFEHRTRRAVVASGIVAALVLVLILNPDASRVYAASVFGALRAPGEPALVGGHRGDRASAPENTLPALQNALAAGMDFVEADMQLTLDGVPVLMHDATIDRTTNGSGTVAALTFAELRTLDAGSWYSPEFANTRVPSVDEFLGILAGSHKKAMLEFKGFWEKEQIRIVTDLVYARGVRDRVIFESFDFTTLRNLEAVAPEFPRVIIRRYLPADPVGLAEYYGAIAILTSSASVEAAPDVVTTMHAAGIGLLLYTLNDEERWSEALAFGVDGIITDRPSRLDDWLAETAPGT